MSPKIKFGTLFAVKTEAADNAVDYMASECVVADVW